MKKDINDSAYWREFEKNQLTHSAAHYLMAIDSLRGDLGYARKTDVADMLDVSRGAGSQAIAHLMKRGWVEEDPNGFLLLSDEGHAMANLVEHNFRILSTFFEEVLGAPREIARGDACKMEHLMSLETGRRLLWFMRHVLSDETRAAEVQEAMGTYGGPDSCSPDFCPLCEGGECLGDPTICAFKAETSS